MRDNLHNTGAVLDVATTISLYGPECSCLNTISETSHNYEGSFQRLRVYVKPEHGIPTVLCTTPCAICKLDYYLFRALKYPPSFLWWDGLRDSDLTECVSSACGIITPSVVVRWTWRIVGPVLVSWTTRAVWGQMYYKRSVQSISTTRPVTPLGHVELLRVDETEGRDAVMYYLFLHRARNVTNAWPRSLRTA